MMTYLRDKNTIPNKWPSCLFRPRMSTAFRKQLKWMYQFSHQQRIKFSAASHTHQHLALTILCLSYFIKCAEVFHCYFNLQFPNSIQCWASFHILIWHLYIPISRICSDPLFLFKNCLWFSCYWFLSILCIFGTSLLSDIQFTKFFSLSRGLVLLWPLIYPVCEVPV